MSRRFLLCLILPILALVGCTPHQPAQPSTLIVWAWERPEDLRFLPAGTEVAVQTGFIEIIGDTLVTRGRRFPLRVTTPPQTALVHIQIDPDRPLTWTPTLRREVAAAVLHYATLIPAPRVQIDFEVRASERPVLLDVLHDIRRALPRGTILSMTALASWCGGERWLDSAPVDEIVPMLFRMGKSDQIIRKRLADGEDFRHPRCRSALAIATDTPVVRAPPGRRVYLFDPKSWTAGDFQAVKRQVEGVAMMRFGRLAIAVLTVAALATGALGSGGPPPMPDYVTSYAQDGGDLAALSSGRLGIMKGAAPSSVLYLDWRLLNGLSVGDVAGKALATPCCDEPSDGVYTWLTARRRVPSAAKDVYFVSSERSGPNYTSIPTCFNDAFVTAAATLDDRIARYGDASPAVGAWLATQDAVFLACSKPGVALPPPLADSPAWLTADRRYQEAALALYDGRFPDAANGFAAIARDKRSPWRPKALYLEARTIQRAALTTKAAPDFAKAHVAIARLAAAPDGTFGKGELTRMRQVLDYNEHPRNLLTRLDHDLGQRAPTPDIAVAFRDYMTLSDAAAAKPDAADWVRTIQAKDRAAGLDHARARWAASGKTAWLVAALSLAMPEDPVAAGLARDAARVAPNDAAWLTAQYHLTRLTVAHADPAEIRARTDAILARSDLTRSDRNIFTAIRAQLAIDLADFARHALRSPYCTATDGTCIGFVWPAGDGLLGKRGASTFVGIGGDARAVIDRLPLRERMTLGDNPDIPRDLRLDLALTNYARAVQLQDVAAIDRLATMLVDLLPQVKDDWRAIAATPPGLAKRFAQFYVMAKIPSLRTDLAGYERPTGPEPEFQGYWNDWLILPRGTAAKQRAFAAPNQYTPEEYWDGNADDDAAQQVDLTCVGKCGAGSFPLHLPAFATALLPRARAERGFLIQSNPTDPPRGATAMWDETLAYVRTHPRDPRAAETLYRLIRVARWGGNHDHLGKRAFQLLHARYPTSTWTEKSPYYYE